jgi:hypothetical protein
VALVFQTQDEIAYEKETLGMNKTKLTAIKFSFLLFLLIHTVSVNDFLVAKAQRQSTPPKLEGTQFEGAVILLPSVNSKLNTYYIFEGHGKVIRRLIKRKQGENKIENKFDMITGRLESTMVYYPGGVVASDEISGTYEQDGNAVRLEFSDRYMQATIKADGLVGFVSYKGSNKKGQWVVAKASCEDFRGFCKSGNSASCKMLEEFCD